MIYGEYAVENYLIIKRVFRQKYRQTQGFIEHNL